MCDSKIKTVCPMIHRADCFDWRQFSMPSAQRDVKWIFQSSKQLRKHRSIDGVKKLCYNRNKKDFEVAYG